MSKFSRFGLGGLGGLLPVLATLVAVDLASIATLVDQKQITEGLCVGIALRVLGLFTLGGIMAAINTEITAPIALVQIGIAAPALVTSYLAGVELNKSQPRRDASSVIFSTANASELGSAHDSSPKVRLAGGFLADVVKGLSPGLGNHLDNLDSQMGRPLDTAAKSPSSYQNGKAIRIINTGTQTCVDIPPELVKSAEQYASLAKSFPPPTYVTELGTCKK